LIPTSLPSKPAILCIDHDEAILHYEKALLERSGYAVLTAGSAEQALRLVSMCKCDAVLLDYEMPVMDGYEIAFEIKRTSPNLTIIMVSAGEMPIHALTMVDAFVPKLDVSRELLPMIAEFCSQTRDPRPNRPNPRIGDSSPRPSPNGDFEYGPSLGQWRQDWEEDS
jgi:CheY-like chemotaxis protein